MKKYVEQTFTIPKLEGISSKAVEEHLKLYAGYVKHTNLVLEQIQELKKDAEKNVYALAEVNRRLGFEYNGMRNHEVYFSLLEGGVSGLSDESILKQAIAEQWGSYDTWLVEFKAIAKTRGIGWAMLYFDKKDNRLVNAWIDEQHLGQLQGCELIVGLDMWEHSYLFDYVPGEKGDYIEAFFKNLNWSVAEEYFKKRDDCKTCCDCESCDCK